MNRIAIISDIHLHDIRGGYGTASEGRLSLRTFADTAASTRVFNESEPALLAVLADIADRGIRDVVLMGDQTDDGQPGAYQALSLILRDHETRFGMRFYATLGNHDAFGPEGGHNSKRLTDGNGPARLVTSDPDAPPPAVFAPGMRGLSTAEAIEAMAGWGLMRPAHGLRWETPFGLSDAVQDRIGADGQIDASYLVEPSPGLWLLMLDANVFSRRGKGWYLHADGAWDHVLSRRGHLAPWIADVVRRAKAADATLLAFSHYPVVAFDALHAPTAGWEARMPTVAAGQMLSETGLKWHFSGHMHAMGQAAVNDLVNIAVPSPVRFPGGYLILDPGQICSYHHVTPAMVPAYDLAFAAYRSERGNGPSGSACTEAESYPDFLMSLHCRG